MNYNKFFIPEKWKLVNEENKSIMDDFLLEYKARQIKNTTIEQYKNDIRIVFIYILDFCNNISILKLNKKDFRKMIFYFKEDCKMSNARINRIMSSCRSMLTYVDNEDEYDYNNCLIKIKGLPKEPVKEIIFLKNEMIVKLYDYFMKHKMYREATLLGLAYESAGRKNELTQVLKSSINEEDNFTNTVVGKRGKTFQLIYFDLTKEAAKKYMEEREDDLPQLFITDDNRPATGRNIYEWIISWREILNELIGEEILFNVHSFRHSALENYSNGSHEVCKKKKIQKVPIEQLSLLANHSSISITQTYLKNRNKKELEKFFKV